MSDPSTSRRSIVAFVLGVVMAGVLVTPSIANHTPAHTAQQIDALGDRLRRHAGLITELRREQENYAAKMNPASAGDTVEVTLARSGPLRFFARCTLDSGGDDTLAWLFTSSEPFFTSLPPFDTPDAAGTEVVMSSTSAATGTTSYPFAIDRGNASSARNGTVYTLGFDQEGQTNALNIFGNVCVVAGQAVTNAI